MKKTNMRQIFNQKENIKKKQQICRKFWTKKRKWKQNKYEENPEPKREYETNKYEENPEPKREKGNLKKEIAKTCIKRVKNV